MQLRRLPWAPLRRAAGRRSSSRRSSSSSTAEAKLPTPWGQPREFAAALGTSVAFIGASMGLGDGACQALEAGLGEFDYERWDGARSARMMLIGSTITGPFSHCWQLVLESLLPGKSKRAVALKIGANSLYAFVFSLPLMFTAATITKNWLPNSRDQKLRQATAAAGAGDGADSDDGDGGAVAAAAAAAPPLLTMADARAKIEQELVPTFIAGAVYWPAANVLVFQVKKRCLLPEYKDPSRAEQSLSNPCC